MPTQQAQFQSLEDVLSTIQADENLSKSRKKTTATCFRVYARVQGKPLDAIAADPKAIQTFCKSFHPAKAGFGQRHWSNVVSALNFALHHVGLISLPGRAKSAMVPEWMDLYDKLNERSLRAGLSRIMRFCSSRGILPSEVDDDVAAEYLRVLNEESLANEPERIHRRAIIEWNRAVDAVAGWPQQLLMVPSNKYRWTYPWDHFPEGLRQQIEAYLARGVDPDVFDDHAPCRALAPETIRGDRYKLQCFCSALVITGSTPEELDGLQALIEPEAIKRSLRYLLKHYKRQKTVYRIAQILRVMARDYLQLDDDIVGELNKICRKIRPEPPGMTDKNRERLRQLDDPRNIRKLLDLPARLLRKAKRLDRGRRDDAILVQLALAIDILTVAPLRLGNLARLNIDKHIQWSRSGREGIAHLVIEAQEVKNNMALEYELPPETVALLRLYLDSYRPRLSSADNSWLFPGRNDNHKVPAVLGKQLSDIIAKETGLAFNPHLFRHAMAKLFLDQNPGEYEVVRRVLGHSAMHTTVSFYAGGEGISAAKHFDRTILQLRDRSLTDLTGGL